MNERTERIKKLIEMSGKSYRELEEITGIKRSSLQRYASGTITKISMDVIERLETALGAPKGYIMGWDEKPAEELEGLGALAAEVIMDQDAMEMAQDYLQLSPADRAAVRALVASLAAKTRKD